MYCHTYLIDLILRITTSTNATSTSTGGLVVYGGVGINKESPKDSSKVRKWKSTSNFLQDPLELDKSRSRSSSMGSLEEISSSSAASCSCSSSSCSSSMSTSSKGGGKKHANYNNFMNNYNCCVILVEYIFICWVGAFVPKTSK